MGQAADLSSTLALLKRELSLTGNDVRLFKAVAQAIRKSDIRGFE